MSEPESNPTSTVLENPPEASAATPPDKKAEEDAATPQATAGAPAQEAVTPVQETVEEPSAAEQADASAPAPEAAVAASEEDTGEAAQPAEVAEPAGAAKPADEVVHTAETAQVDPVPVAARTEETQEVEAAEEAQADSDSPTETARETAGEVAHAIAEAAQKVLETARETAEKVTEASAPAVAAVSDAVQPVVEAVTEAATDATEKVRESSPAAGQVTDAVTEAATTAAHKVQDTAAAAVAAVTAAAGAGDAKDGEKEEKAEAKAEDKPEELDPTVVMLREAKENETPVEGRVIGWNQGGFHVVIDSVTAFCPRSEMEIKNPRSPNFYVDKTFKFQVIKHQKRGRRIVLSRKALLMENRSEKLAEIEQAAATGDSMQGRVSSLTDFGAFVDLGGVEGLVHVTEIDHTRVNHPKDRLKMGQEVEVKVLKVENGGDRISLSMKSLQDNPWKSFSEEHPRGSQFKGNVVRKTDFGLFVELQPGIDGMIHLSQLPPGRKLGDYQEGQELEGWVLRTEPGRERISLSLKEVPEGDPWENVRERYPEGETVEGEVEEVAPFGVFVTLEPGLTGLLPNSSLNVRRGQDASRMFPAGQKIQVQVDSVDLQRKRISLAQEGQRLAGSRHDYKAYQKRQKQEQTGQGGMTAMAAAFAKLQDDRQDEA